MGKATVRNSTRGIFSILLAFVFAIQCMWPSAAFAATSDVQVENHTSANATEKTVHNVTLSGVDPIEIGSALDDSATTSTAEGESWEVPVLWIGDDLELDTVGEDCTQLPAVAFYVPDNLAIEGDSYTVTLSDSLTELFEGREVVSVYDEYSGVTYILPASLRGLFTQARPQNSNARASASAVSTTQPVTNAVPSTDVTSPSIVDIYCSKSARSNFTNEDLEWILDLIMNKLEPRAVELLKDKFPAFKTAASTGEIGSKIGLYVYYTTGDNDCPEHTVQSPNALAYVTGDAVKRGDSVIYGYMLAVNLVDMAKKDSNGNPIVDPKTGKYVLIRDDGSERQTFENTMVHEMFHAVMDDYNRTGMAGATNINDVLTNEKGEFRSEELKDLYWKTYYPTWFIEGTASAVENNWHFRYDDFELLRRNHKNPTEVQATYTQEDLIFNYVELKVDGKYCHFDLGFCTGLDSEGNKVDTTLSAYMCGYLATLYLSELSARAQGASSITEKNGKYTISSEKLRMGLNSILERMHKGETLDQVINDISPTKGKTKTYKDTDDFQDKFIKGVEIKTKTGGYYDGDPESLAFTEKLLNYMLAMDGKMGNNEKASGSILFDFADTKSNDPLDSNKNKKSNTLKIGDSNSLVESTVPNSKALAGGGKSRSGKSVKVSVSASSSASATKGTKAAKTDASDAADEKTSLTSEDVADEGFAVQAETEDETAATATSVSATAETKDAIAAKADASDTAGEKTSSTSEDAADKGSTVVAGTENETATTETSVSATAETKDAIESKSTTATDDVAAESGDAVAIDAVEESAEQSDANAANGAESESAAGNADATNEDTKQ